MPSIWFTSDTHFSHHNIIQYCNRPFKDTDEMNKVLIQNWNNVVMPDDIVWHLGDFALGDKTKIPEIVQKLHGNIRLVKGNHDNRSNQFYRDCGFKEVYNLPVVFDEFIVLSHAPMPFVPSLTMINLYGHVHDSPMFETWGNQCACMCVERHNYTPVNIEVVREHFTKPEHLRISEAAIHDKLRRD